MKIINDVVIVIPALNPDYKLLDYINELNNKYFSNFIVIDDGSCDENKVIFKEIEKIKNVKVLCHDVNRGKGAALKTAFKYIKDNYKNVLGILTVDSDGQHLGEDCYKMAEKMHSKQRGLYLGSRDFDNPVVPFKSRAGNKITRKLFKLLYNITLSDTQTGLRGFLIDDIDLMINIEGNRYEYEMQMLIDAHLAGLDNICIPISTIYENNNEGSHFNPLKDGYRIYRVLFKNIKKKHGK